MESYASLIVSLDLGPDTASRTSLAVNLAERFHARLVGSASRSVIPQIPSQAGFAAATLIEQWRMIAAAELQEIQANFEKVAAGPAISVRTGMDEPVAFLVELSTAADLLIVGRQGRRDLSDTRFAVDPGAIVLSSGRPILVVPPITSRLSGHRIVIAWKNTREARRAIADALPLLEKAEETFVVSLDESAGGAHYGDLQDYLRSHQIAATFVRNRVMREISIAEELIKRANQEGADLLVSGAYGHSRAREWIFGGVTRDIFEQAPICCLMSH